MEVNGQLQTPAALSPEEGPVVPIRKDARPSPCTDCTKR
jgi:hypothetical protein